MLCQAASQKILTRLRPSWNLPTSLVHEAQAAIEQNIIDNLLATRSAARILAWAHSHNCKLLREAGIKLIRRKSKKIMASSDWSLVMAQPDLLSHVLHRVLNPETFTHDPITAVMSEQSSDDGTKSIIGKRRAVDLDSVVPPNCDTFRECYDIGFRLGTQVFRAHRLVLAVHAPGLLEHGNAGEVVDLELPANCTDVQFRDLHAYIYGQELCLEYNQKLDLAMSLLELADRYACVSLKMEVEAKIVELLEANNAARLLVWADSHCCALLTEASVEIVVAILGL